MKYSGTIRRVVTTKSLTTLILDTEIGPRGIELERAEWVHLLRRAGESDLRRWSAGKSSTTRSTTS